MVRIAPGAKESSSVPVLTRYLSVGYEEWAPRLEDKTTALIQLGRTAARKGGAQKPGRYEVYDRAGVANLTQQRFSGAGVLYANQGKPSLNPTRRLKR